MVADGKITDVKVINPGIGYTSTIDVKITPNGSGSILDSSVRDLSVTILYVLVMNITSEARN